MFNARKSALVALFGSLALAVASCGSGGADSLASEDTGSSNSSSTAPADSSSGETSEQSAEERGSEESGPKKSIAILNLANVPSLTRIVDGLVDYLHSSGYDDTNLSIDSENANADISVAQTIATKFVADEPDAIITVTTPALQAAVNATKLNPEIPVLFAAVSDPVSAGAVASLEGPTGTNVAGVYNVNPIPQVLDVAEAVIPDVKSIGIIYNAGEDNSVADSEFVKEESAKRGIDIVEATVVSTNDVQAATQSILDKVDAILLLQDSTVATGDAAVFKLARDAKLPVLSIDADLVKDGAVIGLGRDATQTGAQLGAMVAKVLEGADAGSIALEPVAPAHILVNSTAVDATGMTIPSSIMDQAQVVEGK